ncbi:MAG: hypothetical protein IAE93_09015 [Ignavibacteria bacterium]|nr:hypothetical protein [Ignavibacteria bacterium]
MFSEVHTEKNNNIYSDVPLLVEFYGKLIEPESAYIDEDGKWGEVVNENVSIAFHNGKKRFTKVTDIKLVFYAPDIPKCKSDLEELGYEPGKIFSSGEIEFFNLSDPDGNIIQFSNRN